MLRFEVGARGSAEHNGIWGTVGFRAAAPVVMVVESGSVWVMDQQGDQQVVNAPGVMVWDTGEWVSYGSDGHATVKDYWASRVSDTGFHPCGPINAPKGTPPEWAESDRPR
jgi:hypothetical protein